MSSEVSRNGLMVRPSWSYPGPKDQGNQVSIVEMVESLRNVCEQIRDSQMLRCDVADAIKNMAKEIRGLRRDLKAKRR